jgi:acid stress-induced BolA-like protein IbaG/YrbA
MAEVVYPQKFKDRIKRIFKKKLSEPEITVDTDQLIALFNGSSLFDELKKLKRDSNMIETIVKYNQAGKFEALTFRLYKTEERENAK